MMRYTKHLHLWLFQQLANFGGRVFPPTGAKAPVGVFFFFGGFWDHWALHPIKTLSSLMCVNLLHPLDNSNRCSWFFLRGITLCDVSFSKATTGACSDFWTLFGSTIHEDVAESESCLFENHLVNNLGFVALLPPFLCTVFIHNRSSIKRHTAHVFLSTKAMRLVSLRETRMWHNIIKKIHVC